MKIMENFAPFILDVVLFLFNKSTTNVVPNMAHTCS